MVILRPVGTTGNRLKYLRKIRGLTRKEAAVVAWRCSRILGKKVQDRR